MIHNLKPYPAYRDSGVEWLGAVPAHWELLPGRACFREKQQPNFALQEKTVLSLSYGQIVVKPPEKLHGLVPSSFETYQVVDPSHIVIRPTDLQNDKNSLRFGLSRHRGIITSAYLCFVTKRRIVPEYGYLLLHSYDLMKVFYGLGSGLRQNLDWTDFKHLSCSVPPLPEQTAIVRFLDHADRRIRRYIRAKQKLIALLEEQKQATIHQAVTGQSDVRTGQPYPAYKPSGVEWLGDVPEHWEVRRVKQVSQVLRGKFTHRPRNDPSLYDGPYPFIQTGEVARAEKAIASYRQTLNERGLAVSQMFPAGTLVMTIAANIGDVAILDFEACFPDSVVGFVPRNDIERDFLYYVFRAMRPELLREAPVSTQGNLNIDRIGSRGIAVAPSCEQRLIVRQIEASTTDLDTATNSANRQIKLLHELRTRLIADVVTGKLDVREAAATLPDDASLSGNDRAEVEDEVEIRTEAFEMTDWHTCPAVERKPGKVSGAWVFAGTRIPLSALYENLASGATIDEFVEWFPGVDEQQVRAVLEHEAKALRTAAAP